MGLLKKLKVIYQSLHLQDPSLNKQFVEQSHHSRIVFYYIETVFQCIRLSLSMNMQSPLQLAQLIGGISLCLVSLLFAYFLSSKKFQYYSVIYKLSHIVLYMFNMQKLYNNLATMKQIQLDQAFYFFIFGQVSTIIFHLQLDSLWLEIVSSIGQAIIVLVVVNFDIFQTHIIVFTYVQFSIFQVINIFKSQKKFLLKLNDKSWLSITDYFYQIPIVIIKFDSITNYISLNDCNKTSEKFFDFRGDEKDSDKLNKKMSQFILEDILQADDINNSQNMIKMQLKSPTYNQQNNNGANIYQSQRDLKSYLIKKSAKIIFQKVSNSKSLEEASNVEIISCIYNNIQYEVQILPVIIDFQLSIALQFHQLENQSSFIQERKPAKTLEKSYFNLNITNYNGINTPTQFKSESITKLPLFISSHKKQNININAYVQNIGAQNTPISNVNVTQNQNMNLSNEDKEEEAALQIINFYHSIIQLMNKNIDDLIAMIEYALQFSQSSTLKVQIQSLKLLKQEQKLIFDAVQLKANFTKSQFHHQIQNNQAINSLVSNQLTELSPPILQFHYFDFSDILISLKNHLLVHGYDYYFNIKNLIPQKFQMYSNKEVIQQILQCCIFLITDSCKLKSMHQQQSNMMRFFASNGAPIPQNIIQQNVNNLINALNVTSQQQQQQIQQVQPNHFQHKMMTIELSQIITNNQVSNISVKITNIQTPNILDSQKHSKLATFFFNVLKTYLDKVGILTSLQQKQNEENLRYNICFTILSDCNNVQAQQHQNNQILQLQQTNTGVNRQTIMSSQYVNNSGSPKNTIQFKDQLTPQIENGLHLSNSNKGRDQSNDNNHNASNNSQMNFLNNNKSENKFQINTSLNNNQKLEFYNLKEKIDEQVLNDTEDEEEQSEIVEPGNEYQNDESKLDKIKQTVINSTALVQNEHSHKKLFIANKTIQNTQTFNSKLNIQKIKNLDQQKKYKQINK
ncbi:hypothetical protein ABPG74_002392 [Tetrahymena malaccensis]